MSSSGRLTDEQLQKIRTYRPDPLTPLTPDHSPALRPLIVDGKLGKFVSVDDVSLLNAASHNYLGLVEHTEVQEAGLRCIDKYGIGACGPRTFFGTVDVHLALEHAISAFLGTQETAIYSLGFSTISSVIPAYVKSSDVLFVDEMVNFSIQCGVQAARCSVHWFKHNDSDHLTHCIATDDEHHGVEALSTNVRRFLVLEGIYQRCGSLARLDQLLTVARRHRVRVIIDESISLGVLGRRGRGALEHYQLKTEDVDIICGSLEHAIGSYGGFSSGTHYVIDHQRLNGLGYVFSASLPPMLAASALRALEIIDNDVTMTSRLSSVCRQLHAALHALPGLSVCGDELSPVKFLRLCTSSSSSSSDMSEQDERTLRQIVDQARSEGVLVCVAARVAHQEAINLPPSIRVTAAVHMLPQDINLIHSALSNAVRRVLNVVS